MWQKVVPYAAYADSVAKDRGVKNTAKFEMGVSNYYLATLTYTDDVSPQKSCDGAKQLQDILISSSSELPVGGATNPDIVKQLMPAVQQMAVSADQMVKVYCAPPKKP